MDWHESDLPCLSREGCESLGVTGEGRAGERERGKMGWRGGKMRERDGGD